MRSALIGHTGFLGGNLAAQKSFSHLYNSKNIPEIEGEEFELVICGGVTATKWWANQNPLEDGARIDSLLSHLKHVRARQFVLLSTVDVYPKTAEVDEHCDCHSEPNHPYGTGRFHFEESVRRLFPDATTIRISGVFGPGLKKNVVFDLMHDNCLESINPESRFQYYNAANLWRDIQRVLQSGVRLINLVAEPVRTSDLIARCFNGKPVGGRPAAAAYYDVRTRHAAVLGGNGHYIAPAEEVLNDLSRFVRAV